VDKLLRESPGERALLGFPLPVPPAVRATGAGAAEFFASLLQRGLARVKVHGLLHELTAPPTVDLSETREILVVLDRVVLKEDARGRLTDSMAGWKASEFSSPEAHSFRSREGFPVPALLYKPVGPEPGRRYPAVLRVLSQIVSVAQRKGKWVSVCGEMTSDPRAVPLLIGLGLEALSVSPRMFLRVKQAVRTLSRKEATALVEKALEANDPAEVHRLLAQRT